MNESILNFEVQKYINANLETDLHSLLLKKAPFEEVSMLEIVQQIKGKNVARKKFPFLLQENIVFPVQLSLEQSSSDKTAIYKSELLEGESFIDLTSGFGIDAYYLSKNFKQISLVEQNSALLEVVKHNWKVLERNAEFHNQKLEEFLVQNNKTFDVAYLDPARRDLNKNKVFLLEDLSPNILEIQDQLLKMAKKVVIKLSPLIDLKYLVSEVKNLARIDIIAVKNDVKEIVLTMTKDCQSKINCLCINLESDEPCFEYSFGDEENASATFSEPEKFIYIPNNTILKAGTFNLIAEKFNLKKLHPNTHIYTSDIENKEFPGRVFEMEIVEGKQ
ncbi:MAG: RsmD family RNA methyltransferase, partial [Chryseobacterium sp.]|nr:RsmD family RNA methyltransferase [Candidatus Chryseobacterium enterohippi]